VKDQDSKMTKVIRESRWNVRHEYNANHAEKALDRYCQGLPKEEPQLLYGPGKGSRDWFNHGLHQPISRDKKIEIRENKLNRHCGDHSKCHHPGHQGYQWKNRGMPEAQASLRRNLAKGSKVIQKIDPLSGSTQANESFHAVKRKYIGKRLNITTSTEPRLALGITSQSRNPGWHNELRQSLDISPLPAECSKILWDLESKRQRKNEERREEPERRRRNESRNEWRAKAGRDRKGEDDCYFRKWHEAVPN
jgi:hypothetical protein